MYSHPPLLKRINQQVFVLSQVSACRLYIHGTYKRWDSSSKEKAIKEVELGHMSVRRISETFSVPKSSLHDRVRGRVHCGARPSPSPT